MKKNRCNMSDDIKSYEKKYTAVFMLLIALVVLVCWCSNALFLSKFYTSQNAKNIQSLFENLNSAASEYGTSSDEFSEIFESSVAKYNCDILVLDQDMNVLKANVIDESVETERLLSYFFDAKEKDKRPPRIIEKNDKYTIQLSRDIKDEADFIELWGVLSAGNPIFIRSAVAGINANAKIANVLLAYIGIISVLISFFLCRLVAKILTRNTELEHELKKRKEMDEMRKEFLSNVSHELKTPIALIQGYAEGLVDCVNDDKESRDFYCEVIVDETAKMNKLVRNLLELNELEFGNNNVSNDEFDLNELIRNCIMSQDMVLKQKEIKVEFKDNEPALVISDELKIEQVFNNYFTNAINHADGEKIIRVSVNREKDGRFRVKVFNTGTNIPEESLSNIWDKFYKVDKARTREYGGSGVGLSIVKASMDALNQKYGVINCTDGVEFWFEVNAK